MERRDQRSGTEAAPELTGIPAPSMCAEITPRAALTPRTRHLTVSMCLSTIMPGLGHVYRGELRRGLLLWLAVLTALSVLVLAWGLWVFVPTAPLMVLGVAWCLLLWVVGRDLMEAEARGAGGGHWITCGVILMIFGCGPVIALSSFIGDHMVTAITIADASMYPKLLVGDELLVDRRAYREQPPEVGDLVVARLGDGHQVARVLAVGGETIHLRSGRPIIDGERVPQALAGRPISPHLGTLADLKAYTEQRLGRRYVVTYRADVLARPDHQPITLNEGELFLIGDNRDAALNGGIFGRVTTAGIVGRPKQIWRSLGQKGERREGRAGWSPDALGPPPALPPEAPPHPISMPSLRR